MNISVEITENILEYLDSKVQQGLFKSRSEVVRSAIREMIQKDIEHQLRAKGIKPRDLSKLRNEAASDLIAKKFKKLS